MEINLKPGPTASAFILAVAKGDGDEILALGPRGEAKTISALIAMAYHAKLHEAAGFSLPVTWMGVTDTFNSHKEKTHESLLKPFWQGAWRLEDGGHKAIFRTNKDAVALSLFGIEDKAALDRVRRETCSTWIEEPAATTEGMGVPEDAMDLSITSQRVPTHASVTMLTSNYPAPNHWLWKRFKPIFGDYGLNVHPDDPRRLTFQIPKGDNAYITDEMRAKWLERLSHSPDLQMRLLEGKPAVIRQGRAVAIVVINDVNVGYSESRHVSRKRIYPVEGYPIYFGQDGGHTPVTIIGQNVDGYMKVYASLVIDGGMRQQYEYNVIPWMRRHAPWALEKPHDYIRGKYDISMPDDESDSDKNPIDVVRKMLGGIWTPGPQYWEARKGPLLASFQMNAPGTSNAALMIDPTDAEPLIEALAGGWFYPTDRFGQVSGDQPKKPNHPHEDLGDAFIYWLCSVMPDVARKFAKPRSFKDPKNYVSEYDPFEARE